MSTKFAPNHDFNCNTSYQHEQNFSWFLMQALQFKAPSAELAWLQGRHGEPQVTS